MEIGSVAINLPPTVELRVLHEALDGQHLSPGVWQRSQYQSLDASMISTHTFALVGSGGLRQSSSQCQRSE